MDERMEQLRQSLQNSGGVDEQTLLRLASRTLDTAQQEKMRALLRDQRALTELMQSEQAKALLRRLQK